MTISVSSRILEIAEGLPTIRELPENVKPPLILGELGLVNLHGGELHFLPYGMYGQACVSNDTHRANRQYPY
jgi:hypothetical protein